MKRQMSALWTSSWQSDWEVSLIQYTRISNAASYDAVEEGAAEVRGEEENFRYKGLTFTHAEKMNSGPAGRKKVSSQRPCTTVGGNQGFRRSERNPHDHRASGDLGFGTWP